VLDAGQRPPLKPVWNPAAPVVALGSDDLSITLWDVSDPRRPRLRRRLQTGRVDPSVLQTLYPGFTRDGRTLVVSNVVRGKVTFYDVASGRRTSTLRTAIQGANFAASPDGARFAFDRPRGGLAVVDVASGRTRAVFEQPPPSLSTHFTAGGKRLAMLLTPLNNLSLLFSGDVTTDLTGADTTALGLYDADSFQQIGDALALPGTVPFISSMSPDGTRFATGAANAPAGTAALWDLAPQRWARTACRLAGRNLSRTEWQQYVPNRPYERTCRRWPAG
jgi:WD40 repeat protein